MKILLVSNCPLIESQGSGYVILNTAKSLQSLGHNIEIISPSSLSFIPSLHGRANNIRAAIGMARWVYQNRIELRANQLIILYGGESALAIFLLKKVLKLNIPIILHSNGLELHVNYMLNHFKSFLPVSKKWYHFDQSFIFNYSYNRVDAILTVSNYDRDFAIKFLNTPAEKVTTIEPALPEIFHRFKEECNNKKNIITFCGSWISRKGIESIKIAVPNILRKHPNQIFRIIGTGYAFNVHDHFPEDIISRIEIYPLVEEKDELIRLYSESSIFLFPSFCESFGLVVAEAMYCKCAVITGPTGIAADLINKKEAIVLKIPNAVNVQEALELLIQDTDLRRKLGSNGRQRVTQLKWEKYTEYLNSFINKTINKTV